MPNEPDPATSSSVNEALDQVTDSVMDQVRDGAAQVATAVKPKLRCWLHAGMAPLSLAAGIVLVLRST